MEDRFFRLSDLEKFLEDGERWDARRRAVMDGAHTGCCNHLPLALMSSCTSALCCGGVLTTTHNDTHT